MVRLFQVVFVAAFLLWPRSLAAQVEQQPKLIPSLDGATLYVTYCAVCHGKAADGHGPMAQVLKVAPPNLTEIKKRNKGVFPFEQVQKTIFGEAGPVSHGSREMPIWGPIFSQVTNDRDYGRVRVYNLTKYLESLQK